MVLAAYLLALRRRPRICGKRLLELGCGVGIPSLVALVGCGATKAVLTDTAAQVQWQQAMSHNLHAKHAGRV